MLIDGGNGVNIKSLNQGTLSSITIKFPMNKKEQFKIISRIDAISAQTQQLESIYRRKIADLEEMRKSVLQKAFSGEL